MIYAAKNGITQLDDVFLNSYMSAQSSSLIFDGDLVSSATGSGTTENNLSLSDLSTSFVLTGQTTIGRIELDLKKYGVGADLTVEIRDTTVGGTLKGSYTFPKKLFSATGGFISLPIDLSGLTAGGTYYIVLKMAGDSTNHLRWIGESGGALHYKVFANTPGTYVLKHGVYGANAKTLLNYDGSGNLTEIWRWLPASDGTMIICDKMTPTNDVNGVATKWGVS
jgi:hypothetical protein